MELSVEISGLDRMSLDVGALMRNFAAPVRPVAGQIEEVIFSAVRAQYASRGRRGPHSKEWKRKPATVERYTAMNRGGFRVLNEPMRRTDALFISETTRGGPHSISITEDDSMTRGTDLPYGLIQQKLGRLQFDPTEGDLLRIKDIIRRGVVKDVDHFFDYRETGGAAF